MPDIISDISLSTFRGCSNLASVIIPKSVTLVKSYAFEGCNKLSDVYYTGSKENWDLIQKDSGNSKLTKATMHYDYVVPTADVNDNGEITLEDAIYAMKTIVSNKELTAEEIARIDLSRDGKFTVVDVLMIQRCILEM